MADIEKLKVLAEAARTDNAMYGDPNDWQPSFGLSPAEQAFAEAASPAAVLELIAENERFKAERDQLRAEVEALRAERDALQAENERLRKDAERYRWLKQHAFCGVWHRGDGLALVAPRVIQREVDAAIDAAMAAKEGE